MSCWHNKHSEILQNLHTLLQESFEIACLVSDLLGCVQCSEVIKSIAFVFSMTNTILVLCAAVFIISSGIVVFIGTGE